ncbi:MAG: GNAT family N-acetyltransferase [Candidatus Dormiibacterota bacterium]
MDLITRSTAPSAADRLQVVELESDDRRWLRLVEELTAASPFHHPTWQAALGDAYGLQCRILGLQTEGDLVAGVPFVRVRRLRRRVTVSLPFTDHCPPLARSDRDLAQLLQEALAGAWRDQAVELRSSIPPTSGLVTRQVAVRPVLELEQDPPSLWRRLRKDHKRSVQQARRLGVRVRFGQAESDLVVLRRLQLATRRRLGVPMQPAILFAAIQRHVLDQGRGFVAIAESPGGDPIAAGLFLHHGEIVVHKYSASLADAWGLRPNHLLVWSALAWACEHGYRSFDFGRTDLEAEGLRLFKAGWGARELPLEYTWTAGATPATGRGAASGRVLQGLGVLIRHSPPLVCQMLGQVLYRHAA